MEIIPIGSADDVIGICGMSWQQLFGFPIFLPWDLMKVILETNHVHYIIYLRFYFINKMQEYHS